MLKITTTLCLLIGVSIIANAQVGKKLTRKPKDESSASRVNPVITSPAAGSTINGPFVLVGKAEPNTWINLYVTPIYKLPASPNGKPVLVVSTPRHKRQEFRVKADDNGVWQSSLIEVMFDSKVSDRRIFVHLSQQWGTEYYESKNTEYLASPKLIMLPGKMP